MLRIPLRKYVQEIEVFIQNGNLDEALKHCWFILQTYPKHIQTYRLLGKILMEKGNYEDSYFVLEKVLEVYPDDFVAHIGLSFIAEVNNQLDNAVLHMERAFELQPTNAMLKEELKRLHLKKDGVEPQTIRLTRGALVNMYRRSGLYPQVIAELRIGLQTNPSRTDFKGYLAHALMQTGERIEAVQLCIEILGSSPFNFIANQIVFEVLPHTSEALDTEAFHQRLIDVDPYYLYVGEKIKVVEDVPDIAVNLDKYNGRDPVPDLSTVKWQEDIEEYWNQASMWDPEKDVNSVIDWDSIIEDRLTEPESEFSKEAALPIESETESDSPPEKETFPAKNLMIPQEEVVSDIPGWIFDDAIDASNMDERNLPQFLQPEDEKIPNLSDIEKDETGMVDNEVPTISEPESEAISKDWVKIENEPNHQKKSILEDTQKIDNLENNNEGMQIVLKAIEGNNYRYAIQKLDTLVDKEYRLEEIIAIMENTDQLLSQEPDAWFVLGKAYLKTNQKEKALQAFHNAEKNSLV
ncbi:MAG TPA: hypothetical protein DCK95_04600 [Anaerolineaceae bacterium]|nr:hypothetical protein [Anaerolineaceae bacterium]